MKTIRKFLILLFLISINLSVIYGQRSIKGRVIDENLDELIDAKIFEFNSTELFGFDNNNPLGVSDFNGFFDITIPSETKRLVFAYIGYEFANVELSDSCNYVEIILLYDAIYDFMSSRKIDKDRKKRFDNLSQLHLTAIDRGLFTNKTICFSREFEPNKPRLDEIGKQMKTVEKQIKKDYQNLSVGDTVKIPFGGTWRANGTDNTKLHVWSSFTDTEHFDCLIEGVVIKKYRNRYRNPRFSWISLGKGYGFSFRVTNCENCKFISPVYNGKAMEVGREFEHDMKIFKAIIKKNSGIENHTDNGVHADKVVERTTLSTNASR